MPVFNCKKSDLVQALLRLDNAPYSLVGREPLVDIYNLEEHKRLLMMGRQYAKSTTIASDALMDSATRKFFRTLYVSPRQDQTSEFSNSKLAPFIKYSPIFKGLFIDKDCMDNVGKRSFKNGSEITLRYAFHTADGIRGISADHVCIDEIQDIIMSNVPIIEECLSGSKFQWRTYAGTPKTLNNTLGQKWFQSTQNEWVLKCPHCNCWNIITIESIGPVGLLCKKCKKDLPRDSQGQWIAKRELGNGIYLVGFRVPQVLSPVTPWERIIEKMQTYSTAKFMNEVMALPYDNSANPITESEIRAVCTSAENKFARRADNEGSHLFLALDWGHGDVSIKSQRGEKPTGYTVMSLGRYDWDGTFELLAMKRFSGMESDPQYQVEEAVRIAKKLNVTAVGVDFGGGFMHNAILRDRLGTDRIIEWQANDTLKVSAKWIPEANRMLFNRTECMTDRFVEIKNKRVKFFKFDAFKEYMSDFLTICVDYRGDGRSMFYNHVLPDDAFHSYMMCKMTADYILRS